MTERDTFEANPVAYMMIGDLDKPFHLPECECEQCEAWRVSKDRPTHKELREKEAARKLRGVD